MMDRVTRWAIQQHVLKRSTVFWLSALLLLLAISPVQGAPLTQTACTSWDLTHDFQIAPNQANPNPDSCGNAAVWYFYAGNPTYGLRLLPQFSTSSNGIFGLEVWYGAGDLNSNNSLPHMGINATGVDQHLNIATTWPAGVILVHPFSTRPATVGWQSPVTGIVSVTGSVTDLDPGGGNGIIWTIVHNDTTLASGGYPNGGMQNFANGMGGASLASVPVTAGDFLYVAVGAKQLDYYFDSTQLDLTITLTG
jgi:hypothetical protein